KLSKKIRRNAFTLAETLITLSIIGVVAAMTVPTLMANTQKQSFATALKKTYSNLQNAVKMIPISQNCSAGDYECALPYVEWASTGASARGDEGLAILSQQFKPVHKIENCVYLAGSELMPHWSGIQCFRLPDGQVLFNAKDDPFLSSIGIDINGDKGPNKVGRDVFYFYITTQNEKKRNSEIVVPAGTLIPIGSKLYKETTNDFPGEYWKTSGYCTTEKIDKKTGDSFSRAQCTGRVIEEGKMNY
ncbi:type II secretion system protein, partial [bacterium]|nr:type II secretion system protein [bacterium]